MMKLILTSILVLGSILIQAQQASLIGTINDAEKKQALELATITLRNTKDTTKLLGTRSKENGSFELKKIPFGNYNITVSSIGYSSKTFENYSINN